MNLPDLLAQLFPAGHSVKADGSLVTGEATVAGQTVSCLGTTGHTFIGAAEAVALASRLLDILEQHPGRTVVMLVDNNGQRMALAEELLVLPEYIALLVRTQEAARLAGCKLVAIVYGNSIAGGFIAFGMGADRVVSVPGSETSVMKLEAISRVTKMPLDQLQALAKKVSVFAPGCENFYKMGGLYEMWTDNFPARLEQIVAQDDARDHRAELGQQRGGRTVAHDVITAVLGA
jgi:malonate decarboxylase gamma subunit